METLDLSDSEKKLCTSVESGEPCDLGEFDTIRAKVLRRIVLGRGFTDKADSTCSYTAVGITIKGGIIDGRLDLASAVTEMGGPICPLQFEKTQLNGGFCGRHGRFSRLSFKDCTFTNRAPVEGESNDETKPTIELTGAGIDSDLDLDGVAPGIPEPGVAPYLPHRLWIAANGVRIDGGLWLQRARLSAPRPGEASADGGTEALDLSLAEVAGDFQFNRSHMSGRVKGRGLTVKGDVWMEGTVLNGVGREALLFQSAKIGGVLVLREGFEACGQINLHQLKLDGRLVIQDATLSPSADPGTKSQATGGKGGRDMEICLCLDSATICVSALIESMDKESSRLIGHLQLAHLKVTGELTLSKLILGAHGDPPPEAATIDARGLEAGGLNIFKVNAAPPEDPYNFLSCDLTDARLGRLNIVASRFTGPLRGSPIHCTDTVTLAAEIADQVDLEGADIGGSFDISRLHVTGSDAKLTLKDGNIGRALQLSPEGPDDEGLPRSFEMTGTIDLQRLTCATLDDEAGRLWGSNVQIRMNHFVYRHVQWYPESCSKEPKKPSHRMVFDWLLAKRAEGGWPWHWIPPLRRPEKEDFWEPWQIRRDWIYREYVPVAEQGPYQDPLVSISRHWIDEAHFRPQPLEQAIRVARAEGHEDFATHFELLKKRIEWGYFNRLVRWWLGFAAIGLASAWLIVNHGPKPGFFVEFPLYIVTILSLAATLLIMLYASRIHDGICWVVPRGLGSRSVLWVIFFLPAFLLLVHSEWMKAPFYFFTAFLIFLIVRCIAVMAHVVMRYGFGYLRRPVRAILTLMVAFLIGWWGVHLANRHAMLVLTAEPVAGLVGEHQAQGVAFTGADRLMGSENVGDGNRFIRDIPCRLELSEPLYALDVLVPLVDLHEESRCEIRRVAESGKEWPRPERMGWGDLWKALPDMTVDYHRFWWLMKALYAIAGWFIVSLSILTFAQVNRTEAETPQEG
jgi:hypothetical protein